MGRHGAALFQQFAERSAFDQLHHQEDIVVVHTLVEDIHERRVAELRHRAGLALEAGAEGGFAGERRIHHLDRHFAVQARVDGCIDCGHATAGDLGADAVAPLQQVSGV